ncbi:MAG: 50S ribosomal protein L11 methyltransferase [Bacteroidota bacterium]|nr:50S ribosomal protein L11 methyltransferase [Bacteroidota bacterium]
MNYLAYHFTVNPAQPGTEILMALISEYNFDSFDTNEKGFTAYIKEEHSGEVDLKELAFDDFAFSYSVEKIAQTNWNSEWEKNFEPVLVKDLLCIRAPFHPKNETVKNEIVIMPKMSFGTGHHQTTRLVCEQMFSIDFKNKRVLDMGCGTGVLAILAKQLGATDILAIDIDDWSVENSIENCATNNALEIVVKKGDVADLKTELPFDILLANINKNILKQHLPSYASKLNKNGILILSGFFMTDVEELKLVAKENGLNYLSTNNEVEWAMLVFSK